MKKGFTPLNLTVPKKVKAFYEAEARRLMVTTTSVARAVLAKHAEEKKAEAAEAAQ